MSDLIEALQIFLKYKDIHYPTNCCHDVFQVAYEKDDINEEDIKRLDKLSFNWSDEYDCFISYRFGSC